MDAYGLELTESLLTTRPLLSIALRGNEEQLAEELDRERRHHMRANQMRLEAMQRLMEPWRQHWPELQHSIAGLPLAKAHQQCVEAATRFLPSD